MENTEYKALMTRYAKDMDITHPWSEYPRPSMVRDSYASLNGQWDFSVCRFGESPSYNDKILVPFPPESALSGYEKLIPAGGVMFYRRNFTLPHGFVNSRVLLHFGAVDCICEVYLNGSLLGEHHGGYLPFSFDITEALLHENELCVKVIDELDGIYPYGKQRRKRGGMWYTPVSGIWQSVWLESVPDSYIRKLKITPSCESVTIEVIGGVSHKKITLESGEVFEFSGEKVTLSPKECVMWTPENPKLYYFTLESGEDRVRSYFALREVSIKEVSGIPRICLNGEPYLFNGLLDQGYYSDGIFLPATSKGYEDDIRLAKSLGFNMLRKHIKVEPEVFYHLCDKLGMIVFQDMVNNSGYSFFFDTALPTVGMKKFPDKLLHRNKRTRKIFAEHMQATVEHLYSFPSIMYYTIFNEGWGQFSSDEMYRKLKELDPTRIIDSTSGWFWQKESDVDSRHVYFKPVKLGKRGTAPIVISEFGGYSHRVDGHLFGKNNYGYKLFDTREGFEDALIHLYTEEIEPLVPLGISALVYTQVSDVEDETNGLVTYDREIIKVNPERILPIMERIKSKIK